MPDPGKIELFLKWVEESRNIVFFGGAGVSTESGIPDFRSESGLYTEVNDYPYPPETILSHSFFLENTEMFYRFYKANMLRRARPNITHYKLEELERAGKLVAVITQNIDGLHLNGRFPHSPRTPWLRRYKSLHAVWEKL